jgi:hypothetical protein
LDRLGLGLTGFVGQIIWKITQGKLHSSGSGGWRGLGLGGPVGSSSTQRDLLDRLFGMDGGVIWELILLYIFFSRELNPSRQNSINPKP